MPGKSILLRGGGGTEQGLFLHLLNSTSFSYLMHLGNLKILQTLSIYAKQISPLCTRNLDQVSHPQDTKMLLCVLKGFCQQATHSDTWEVKPQQNLLICPGGVLTPGGAPGLSRVPGPLRSQRLLFNSVHLQSPFSPEWLIDGPGSGPQSLWGSQASASSA